jgi:hypothetical protein
MRFIGYPLQGCSPPDGAAFLMTAATSNGCNNIATWLDGISTVVAGRLFSFAPVLAEILSDAFRR